eukprot:5331963-Amphidinium_carterae.1
MTLAGPLQPLASRVGGSLQKSTVSSALRSRTSPEGRVFALMLRSTLSAAEAEATACTDNSRRRCTRRDMPSMPSSSSSSAVTDTGSMSIKMGGALPYSALYGDTPPVECQHHHGQAVRPPSEADDATGHCASPPCEHGSRAAGNAVPHPSASPMPALDPTVLPRGQK